MNPKSLTAVLPGLCALLLSGCYHFSTTAERDASFAPYASLTIHDSEIGGKIDLLSYVALRAALIPVPSTQQSSSGIGSAAAIDRRGYYLTAAHCLPSDTTALQVWRNLPHRHSASQPVSVLEEAVVVWRGDEHKGEPDLALLYAPRPPALVFAWAPEIKTDTPAVAAGINYEKPPVTSLASGGIGGTLLSSAPQTTSAAPWQLLTTTLPLHGGDSGGPLATTDGHLLGINYLIRPVLRLQLLPPWIVRYQLACATRPDLEWLRRLIDEDYAKRPRAAAIAAFWRRTDAAEFLSNLLLDRLRELEATRLATNAPDDRRAAYDRQELLRKTLSDEAGIADPFFVEVRDIIPRAVPTEPVSPADVAKVAAVLRAKLMMK